MLNTLLYKTWMYNIQKLLVYFSQSKGEAEIAGVEITRVDKIWQVKVLTCISDCID